MILLAKKKLITKSTKEKYKKDQESIIEVFQKMKNFKNNYANNRNKYMSDAHRETKNR